MNSNVKCFGFPFPQPPLSGVKSTQEDAEELTKEPGAGTNTSCVSGYCRIWEGMVEITLETTGEG